MREKCRFDCLYRQRVAYRMKYLVVFQEGDYEKKEYE